MNSKTYRIIDNQRIEGRIFHAIRFNHKYFFVEVKVYADGIIECWEPFNLSSFNAYLESGKIRVDVPNGTSIHIYNLGEINVKEFLPEKTKEDFIKEIEDCIKELNGKKGRVSKCVDGYETYLLKGDRDSLNALKKLYDDLPSHQRVLFEIAYYKDPLVALMKTDQIQSKPVRQGILEDYFYEDGDE